MTTNNFETIKQEKIHSKVFHRHKIKCVDERSQTEEIEYHLNNGHRLVDRQDQELAFAFNNGLSYTAFMVNRRQLERDEITLEGTLIATIKLRNTGSLTEAEMIQRLREFHV